MLRLIGFLELELERNATHDILPSGVLSSINAQCGQMIEATYIFLEIMATCEDFCLFSDCLNVEQPMGSYFFRTTGKGWSYGGLQVS